MSLKGEAEMISEDEKKQKHKITTWDVAAGGLMIALIEVSKAALSFLPNIELTSFWLILFTLFFGWKIAVIVPVLILVEGAVYGFGLWWFMYLYIWPLLVLLAWVFRRQESVWFWALFSGAFGLCFGALCTLAQLVVSVSAAGTLRGGLYAAFSWWIAGIPWDITHCIGNFVLMLLLYHPVRHVMRQMLKNGWRDS